MWKPLRVLAGALCGAALAMPSFAATATITGTVVDLVCYARNKANTGADHDQGRACAQACVKWEGNPVAVVTSDGKVYQLAGEVVAKNNAKIAPHLAHTVTVTGDVSTRDGMLTMTATDVRVTK